MTKKYSMTVNTEEKTIDMKVTGTFDHEDVQNFVNDYQTTVNSIIATEYTLEVDCTNMDLLSQEMVPALENSFKMYHESGFKKVNFNIKNIVVLKMQLNRIARDSGLTNAEVVVVA
jgi:hypothetical protein